MLFVRTQLTQHIQMELPLMLMGTWAEGQQWQGSPDETVSTSQFCIIPKGDAKGQATGSLT